MSELGQHAAPLAMDELFGETSIAHDQTHFEVLSHDVPILVYTGQAVICLRGQKMQTTWASDKRQMFAHYRSYM